jgi:hypothetical protein
MLKSGPAIQIIKKNYCFTYMSQINFGLRMKKYGLNTFAGQIWIIKTNERCWIHAANQQPAF